MDNTQELINCNTMLIVFNFHSFNSLHTTCSFCKKKKLKFDFFFQNLRYYLKNHCTNTRLVCICLNAFFMLNPNMAIKIFNFLKKFEIFTHHLHSTSVQRGINSVKIDHIASLLWQQQAGGVRRALL